MPDSSEMRARETQPPEARLHFRNIHEELPQQAGAVILHHHDNRALVDGDVGVGIPVALFAERIGKTIPSPQLFAMLGQEVSQSAHDFAGCIWKTRERPRRRNRTVVIVRSMCRVAVRIVAGSQPPTVRTVPLELVRVGNAVRPVDGDVALIEVPVVRIFVFEASLVESAY